MYDHIKNKSLKEIGFINSIDNEIPSQVLLNQNKSMHNVKKLQDDTFNFQKYDEKFYDQLKYSKNPCIKKLKVLYC